MNDRRDIRNTGIFVGGNIENSKVSVTHSGPAGGDSGEARLLQQLAELLADLEAQTDGLPAGQRADVRAETVRLRTELESAERDSGRISGALDKLKAATAAAAPLVTLVSQIADLVTKLH